VRLDELEITGFGRLGDLRIAFHPRTTVVLGNNESGKSTLQRAVRAALFGLDSGGQGRAVERSDWQRWRPWVHQRYGLSLTYELRDGRRIRVARRLDSRDHVVQVMELGGSDVTNDVREGRVVAPGLFHLGFDEQVFCATAWLGEDGLRLGSHEAPVQRATELQEAIERVADTGGGVTAAQAVGLLRDAMDRVGSERRLSSPLGVATARLRELESALDDARRRVAAIAGEEERLRELELTAGDAEERRVAAERAWLVGRLAELAHRRRELGAAAAEIDRHANVVASTEGFAAFRTDDEDSVIALGAELNQAILVAAEAAKRWESSEPSRETVRRRRADIAAGLRALTAAAPGTPVDEIRVRELHSELAAAAASWARLDTSAVVSARRAALRREIAATGFGGLPAESVDSVAALLSGRTPRPLPWWTAPAVLAGLFATAAGAFLLASNRAAQGTVVLLAAAAAAAMSVSAVLRSRRARRAAWRRQLAGLQGLGIDSQEIARLAEKLPSLRALRAALLREEALTEARRLDAQALFDLAIAIRAKCATLAEPCGLAVAAIGDPASAEVHLDCARNLLSKLDGVIASQRRKAELVAEDRELQLSEMVHTQVEDELERARTVVAQGTSRLRATLAAAGIAPPAHPGDGVAAFRHACGERRRHDEAARALEEVRRRVAALGGDASALRNAGDHLAAQLVVRGGDPELAETSVPLDPETLRRLESEADCAMREASASLSEAKALRARLSTLHDTVPDLADLEDERSSCAAARDRGLRQLAALQQAILLIEQAARGTHRDLAPRLAEAVQSKLSLLTDSRYERVNIDTASFRISLLGRDRPDFLPLEHASQGTRDQVSLLLRLALCEVLSASGEAAPLLLDEPLLTSDAGRRRTALEFLHRLSATHQLVLTTSSELIAEQVLEIAGEACAVVRLDGEPTLEATGRLLPQRSPAMRTRPSSSETSSVKSGIRATGTSPSRSTFAS